MKNRSKNSKVFDTKLTGGKISQYFAIFEHFLMCIFVLSNPYTNPYKTPMNREFLFLGILCIFVYIFAIYFCRSFIYYTFLVISLNVSVLFDLSY